MTRARLTQLAHQLHNEPRRHDWTPTLVPRDPAGTRRCTRAACNWRWRPGHDEPVGCTGTDPDTTANEDAR